MGVDVEYMLFLCSNGAYMLEQGLGWWLEHAIYAHSTPTEPKVGALMAPIQPGNHPISGSVGVLWACMHVYDVFQSPT